MAKYCARIALGFSNSVPGGILKPENIHEAADIGISSSRPTYEKAPDACTVSKEGELLSDGCGFTTLCTLDTIQKRLGWSSMPMAVQLRTFGSKVMHP